MTHEFLIHFHKKYLPAHAELNVHIWYAQINRSFRLSQSKWLWDMDQSETAKEVMLWGKLLHRLWLSQAVYCLPHIPMWLKSVSISFSLLEVGLPGFIQEAEICALRQVFKRWLANMHLYCAVAYNFYSLLPYLLSTKRHGQVVNTPASYSGGPGFKSWLRDWLSWLRFFMVFHSPSRQIWG
jgi:hypothetical protein